MHLVDSVGRNERIANVLRADGPVLCEVSVPPEETASPREGEKAVERDVVSGLLEDMWPYLRQETL